MTSQNTGPYDKSENQISLQNMQPSKEGINIKKCLCKMKKSLFWSEEHHSMEVSHKETLLPKKYTKILCFIQNCTWPYLRNKKSYFEYYEEINLLGAWSNPMPWQKLSPNNIQRMTSYYLYLYKFKKLYD